MRIAVISCWKYRDAWWPFKELLNKFWPTVQDDRWLLTDCADGVSQMWAAREVIGYGFNAFVRPFGTPWAVILSEFAAKCDQPILLFQEDFFLSEPVSQELIQRGLDQMEAQNAGCVRLYPCPGSDEDYGDPHFGIVKRGSPYRISLQCGIWHPSYLYSIASRFNTPQEFELEGTPYSNELPREVLAFKRDVHPYPLSYECTAIVNGKWTQSAKKLCDAHGIEVDWSLREFAVA